MIAVGLRWRDVGTRTLTWTDFNRFVRGAQPGSAIFTVLSPGGAGWSPTDYLLADLIDATNGSAYYAAAAAGVKRPKKPKPYPRPGVTPKDRDARTFRTKPMPIDEMRRWLGWD